MPVQGPQWTEYLSCPICFNAFDEAQHRPISLGCGHTVCKACLSKLHQKKCPFDQTAITRPISELPVNFALLQLVGVAVPDVQESNTPASLVGNFKYYESATKCIEELAIFLKPLSTEPGASLTATGNAAAAAAATAAVANNSLLSRPMQRKLVCLVSCQLVEEEGRSRAMRSARSLGDRTVTELILQHQNAQQLSANLWAAVRARGCQFLGPAMQEEVLRLILLALEDGSALSRKVLVLFVVQRLESQYPQASKTAIGHVVQLLYRASCFKVTKREEESSLMQLKEELRTYDALRREHDAQIVQIATEAGLRIAPEQWSSLLYGDTAHKSHMQSIIDKLQTPQSFSQSVNELVIALQRTGDPGNLSRLRPHLELLASIDPNPDAPPPSWQNLDAVVRAAKAVVQGLVEFVQVRSSRRQDPAPLQNSKYKTSMCRDLNHRGTCPRGSNCTFAHSKEEMEKYRTRNKKLAVSHLKATNSQGLTAQEQAELDSLARSHPAIRERPAKVDISPVAGLTESASHVDGARAYNTELRSGRVPPVGITVPVVKPSILPAQPRNVSRQTIYTSPGLSHVLQNAPEPVPVTHRVHSVQGPQPSSEVAGSHTPTVEATHPVPPPYEGPSIIQYALPPGAVLTHMPYRTPWQGEVVQHVVTEEAMMRNTVAMPPNPYTSNKWAHSRVPPYSSLSGRTVGKLPSEQLDDLHQRRDELLALLNKHKQTCRSSAASMAPQAVPEPPRVDEARPGVRRQHVSLSMSMSVADSIGTTHSTMSIEGKEQSGFHTKPTSSDGQADTSDMSGPEDYVTWSAGENSVEDEHLVSSSWSPYGSPDSVPCTEDTPASSWQGQHCSATEIEQVAAEPLEDKLNLDAFSEDDQDEFVPWEHTVVSRFGPISRMAKTKMKNTRPVQVTAPQAKDTHPVTAVTPIRRPFPVATQVPSRFATPGPQLGEGHPGMIVAQHQMHPCGSRVAASLPTAMMCPTVSSSKEPAQANGLRMLTEKLLNMPGSSRMAAGSSAEREQICQEIQQLNSQIHSLQASEEDRLSRELQAIELNIKETKRHMQLASKEVGRKSAGECAHERRLGHVVACEPRLDHMADHSETVVPGTEAWDQEAKRVPEKQPQTSDQRTFRQQGWVREQTQPPVQRLASAGGDIGFFVSRYDNT